jgi:hypothetical protein
MFKSLHFFLILVVSMQLCFSCNEILEWFELACQSENHDPIMKKSTEIQKCINYKDSAGRTLLIIAAKHNKFEFVKFLIENHTPNVNMCDEDGRTVLHHAVSNLDVDTVFFLVSLSSINCDVIDNRGETASQLIINVLNDIHCDNSEHDNKITKKLGGLTRFIAGMKIQLIINKKQDKHLEERLKTLQDLESIAFVTAEGTSYVQECINKLIDPNVDPLEAINKLELIVAEAKISMADCVEWTLNMLTSDWRSSTEFESQIKENITEYKRFEQDHVHANNVLICIRRNIPGSLGRRGFAFGL